MSRTQARILEIVQAIEEEIQAFQSESVEISKLFNGELANNLTKFTYSFQLLDPNVEISERFLSIKTENGAYKAELVYRDNQQLKVRTEVNLGKTIPYAVLTSATNLPLEFLKQKLLDNFREVHKFELAEAMLDSRASRITVTDLAQSLSTDNALTARQNKAIQHTLSHSLSVIWGPAGEDRTRLLASIVEAHMNAGRKVLLVSQTNAGVDSAVSAVAEHLENTYYKNRQILRLGELKSSELAERFPLLSVKELLSKDQSERAEKALAIDKRLDSCVQIKAELKQLQIQIQERNLLREKSEKCSIELGSLLSQRNTIEQEHKELEKAYLAISQNFDKTAETARLIASGRDCFERMNMLVNKAVDIDKLCITLAAEQQKLSSQLMELTEKIEKQLRQLRTEETNIELLEKALEQDILDSKKSKSVLDKTPSLNTAALINDAKLIATTIMKTTSYGRDFFNADVLIVDEPSQSTPATLYWAASMAKKAVTLIGEYKPLQSTPKSEKAIVTKWLGGNIFDWLQICSDQEADRNSIVSMLEAPAKLERSAAETQFYDAQSFWPVFYQDLERCRESLEIVTGFVGKWRSATMLQRLARLINRGVKVTIYTRPPAEHGSIDESSVWSSLHKLRELGAQIYVLSECHQKAAFIDHQVLAWDGSLNIMSAIDAKDKMTRFSTAEAAHGLRACLKLSDFQLLFTQESPYKEMNSPSLRVDQSQLEPHHMPALDKPYMPT